MDISALSVTELKALAFDELARMEACRQNLAVVQERIDRLSKEEEQKEKSPVTAPAVPKP